MTTKEIGDFGEKAAGEFLENAGLKLVRKNFHSPMGEIDIIAKEGETLVFVEVKTRLTKNYGLPSEFVDFRKQEKIIKTALFYTKRDDVDMRFDVVEVIYTPKGDTPVAVEINHIKNAF